MIPTGVTVTELVRRMERGEPVVFIDSRSPDAWSGAATKLPGAIRVAAGEEARHLNEIPRDCVVVTYCTCPQEISSLQVAQVLKCHGFEEVFALAGGFAAWVREWLPLEPKSGVDDGILELVRIKDKEEKRGAGWF
jgi:rhodanese-related sulfurtransferase